MAPFAIIWLLFLLMYITLPYTRVPFKPAAIGASFTGAIWVVFILGFIVYVKAFAQGTFAIYGALSAIPLSLLMIYASSLIIMYGAEVAYTLQYPETYRNLKKTFRERDRIHVYNGIVLLQHIYRAFESGKGASSLKDIQKAIPAQADEINLYVKLFLEDKLIIQNPDGSFMPANSSNNILVNKVMDSIMELDLEMPVAEGKSMFRQFMSKLFNDINSSKAKIIGDLTLKDLIDKE